MKKFLKSRHSEKGFTLIELLVVVAILGIIAAIVIPNVAGFMGKGKVESANTESHNVQTAVIAFMVDHSLSDYTGDVGPASGVGTAADFLLNVGQLQAIYSFEGGEITGAVLRTDISSKWTGLVWDPVARTWKETP